MLRLQLNIDVNKITQKELVWILFFVISPLLRLFYFSMYFYFFCVGCDYDDVRNKDVINLAVLLLLLYLLYRENSCAILNKCILFIYR